MHKYLYSLHVVNTVKIVNTTTGYVLDRVYWGLYLARWLTIKTGSLFILVHLKWMKIICGLTFMLKETSNTWYS